MNKIAIIGAGQFGTAIGNSLTLNRNNEIYLFTEDEKKVIDIKKNHKNSSVFPNTILDDRLYVTSDFSKLENFSFIFLAIPSLFIEDFIKKNKRYFRDNSIIVNLSKGLINSNDTIVDYLEQNVLNCSFCSMKGPTFASELINGAASIFTLGYRKKKDLENLMIVCKGTNIYLDYTTDIIGVEVISVIKNIYAIMLGYIDAKYNSANTRFLILTKAFREMKLLGMELGANEDTINLSCGYGDLGLTSLNDLSRNRTLGLLMGKGFYLDNNNKVVLEGQRALNMISKKVSKNIINRLPIFNLVNLAFNNEGKIKINFDKLINENEKIVITYGTFDLLHYGHLEILRRSKKFGSKLIVALSTDDFNKIKGKSCIHSYEKRKELLESLSYVWKVIPEKKWEQKIDDIINNNVDVFIMGDDWKGKFDFLKEYCAVEYLPRTKGISTTQLKKIIE